MSRRSSSKSPRRGAISTKRISIPISCIGWVEGKCPSAESDWSIPREQESFERLQADIVSEENFEQFGNTEAGRTAGQPNPTLAIDLSDAESIARTAHAVAVALAEGRLSGRAGQAS